MKIKWTSDKAPRWKENASNSVVLLWAADPLALENEQLRKDNARLAKRIKQVELIIDVQKM